MVGILTAEDLTRIMEQAKIKAEEDRVSGTENNQNQPQNSNSGNRQSTSVGRTTGMEGIDTQKIITDNLNSASESLVAVQSTNDAVMQAQLEYDAARSQASGAVEGSLEAASQQLDAAQTRTGAQSDLQIASMENTFDTQKRYSEHIDATEARLQQTRNNQKTINTDLTRYQLMTQFKMPVYDDAGQVQYDSEGNIRSRDMNVGEKVIAFFGMDNIRQNYQLAMGRSADNRANANAAVDRLNGMQTFIAAEAEKLTYETLDKAQNLALAEATLESANNLQEFQTKSLELFEKEMGFSSATLDFLRTQSGIQLSSTNAFIQMAELGKSYEWYQIQSGQYRNSQDFQNEIERVVQQVGTEDGTQPNAKIIAELYAQGRLGEIEPTILSRITQVMSGANAAVNDDPRTFGLRLERNLNSQYATATESKLARTVVDTLHSQARESFLTNWRSQQQGAIDPEDEREALQAAGLGGSSTQWWSQAKTDPTMVDRAFDLNQQIMQESFETFSSMYSYSVGENIAEQPEIGLSTEEKTALYDNSRFFNSEGTSTIQGKQEMDQAFDDALHNIAKNRDATPEDITNLVNGIHKIAEHQSRMAQVKLGIPSSEPVTWTINLRNRSTIPIVGMNMDILSGEINILDKDELRNAIMTQRIDLSRQRQGSRTAPAPAGSPGIENYFQRN